MRGRLLPGDRQARDCDAVIINSLQPAALIAAKALSRPTVLRLIESYAGASAESLAEVQRLATAASLLLPSRHMAGLVAAWGIPEDRMRVIPYAYDQIFAQQIALVTVRSSRARAERLPSDRRRPQRRRRPSSSSWCSCSPTPARSTPP